MSCVESCSTDSGVEKPATVRTRVAPGAAGGGGTDAAVSIAARSVSRTLATFFRSTGWHAAATARVIQRTVALIRALPPRPGLRCAARRAHGWPRRCGLRAVSNSAVGTYPRRTSCALPGVCAPRQGREPELAVGRTEVPVEVR